eukprot:298552_1
MAAILCRIFIVKPYQACYKCCRLNSTQYVQNYYEFVGQHVDNIFTYFYKENTIVDNVIDVQQIDHDEYKIEYRYKPFSGCLFMSIVINSFVLVNCVLSILFGWIYGNQLQCDLPLTQLLVSLFICAFTNGLFTCYMYHTLNYSTDNPIFNKLHRKNNYNITFALKLWEFFKYDLWMAVYIIFIVFKVIILVISIAISINCNSSISNGVLCTSILLFVYLILSILVLFSYIAFEAFKEMTHYYWCWFLPILWPCLFIGYGLITISHAKNSVHKYKLFCFHNKHN